MAADWLSSSVSQRVAKIQLVRYSRSILFAFRPISECVHNVHSLFENGMLTYRCAN